ncbi:MAG: lipopolysaccharide biosynthesis protein [Planctomycetia bacterium]|nr:lipopolysaccharide biosynthesis protein [Planctomycetia bacterium]
MTTREPPPEGQLAPEADGLRADSLAASIFMLAAITIVQRGIGFVRGLLFCRWLDPLPLGEWDMAMAFLNLAAPIAVLGISGSFGRYLPYFLHRGQARPFLRRTTLAMGVLTALAAAMLFIFRPWFSRWIFGEPGHENLVLWLVVCLVILVGHNLLMELFGGLRKFRVVAGQQFCHSLAFAVAGVALALAWQPTAEAVLAAFAVAGVFSIAVTLLWLRPTWRGIPQSAEPLSRRDLWGKLVPFAAAVWITNWLANLFEVVGRYVLVHFSGLSPDEALAAVGNYHSALVLPTVMVSVTALVRTALLPHLSHDWEAGDKARVVARMNLALKLAGLGLVAASLALQTATPWIFATAFRGKFAVGLSVTPWALVFLAWSSLASLAGCYLWCAERAGWGSRALAAGLAVNVALCFALVPHFGLTGMVLAASAAHFTVLVCTLLYNRMLGMHVEQGTWAIMAAPLCLAAGPAVTAVVLVALAHQAATRDWLLTAAQKAQLAEVVRSLCSKLRIRRWLRRPATTE